MNIVIMNIQDVDECYNFISKDMEYMIYFLHYGRIGNKGDYILANEIKNKLECRYFEKPMSRLLFKNYSLRNKGKWKNIYDFIVSYLENTDIFDSYFYFPDPDIKTTVSDINRLFQIAKDNELSICQSSLTKDSKCSHKQFINNGETGIRQERFCEIMMPMFSYQALLKNLWTFNLTYSGYGIDLIWGQNNNCYVINDIQMKHRYTPHYNDTSNKWGFTSPLKEFKFIKDYYLTSDY